MSRALQNETERKEERKRETTSSGEGELSILRTWAFIDNPMAEGEVKRNGTAYRLDSTRIRDPPLDPPCFVPNTLTNLFFSSTDE